MKRLIVTICALAFSPLLNAQEINAGAGASAGSYSGSSSGLIYQPTYNTNSRSEHSDFSRRAPFISIPSVQPTADCLKVINAGGSTGGILGANAFGIGAGWTYDDLKCRAMQAYLQAAATVNPQAAHAERFLKLSQCQIAEYWRNWETIAEELKDPSLKCPNVEPAGGVVVVKLRQARDKTQAMIMPTEDERKRQERFAAIDAVFPEGSGYSH